jgi:hypothetical protein
VCWRPRPELERRNPIPFDPWPWLWPIPSCLGTTPNEAPAPLAPSASAPPDEQLVVPPSARQRSSAAKAGDEAGAIRKAERKKDKVPPVKGTTSAAGSFLTGQDDPDPIR